MENKPENRKQGQLITGVLVIGMGLIFLLNNLDIVSIHHWSFFWPTVLIGLGIVKVVQSRALSGYLLGAGLIFLGVLLFFSKLGLFHFTMKLFWPLALICFGFMILNKSETGHGLFRRGKQRWSWEPDTAATDANAAVMPEKTSGVSLDKDPPPVSATKSDANSSQAEPNADEELLDITAVMGGYQRSVRTNNFRGGEINALMGGCELDLRECSIKQVAEIQVFVVCGGISIRVPPDWLVVLQGNPILGGFDEQTATPPNHAKRLIVKGYAIMGGVDIRN
jgi:hypothetical protein